MAKTKIVYWQDGSMWLGYLENYPDYWTQGESLEKLKKNLVDIYRDIESGTIPCIRKVEEITIP